MSPFLAFPAQFRRHANQHPRAVSIASSRTSAGWDFDWRLSRLEGVKRASLCSSSRRRGASFETKHPLWTLQRLRFSPHLAGYAARWSLCLPVRCQFTRGRCRPLDEAASFAAWPASNATVSRRREPTARPQAHPRCLVSQPVLQSRGRWVWSSGTARSVPAYDRHLALAVAFCPYRHTGKISRPPSTAFLTGLFDIRSAGDSSLSICLHSNCRRHPQSSLHLADRNARQGCSSPPAKIVARLQRDPGGSIFLTFLLSPRSWAVTKGILRVPRKTLSRPPIVNHINLDVYDLRGTGANEGPFPTLLPVNTGHKVSGGTGSRKRHSGRVCVVA